MTWWDVAGGLCTGLWLLSLFVGLIRINSILGRKSVAAYQPMVQRWAIANDFSLLGYERRILSPWMMSRSPMQLIFYVKLRGPDGRIRRAWLLCGGWFLGTWTDRVVVRWDGPSRAPDPEPPPIPAPDARDDPMWDRSLDC